MDDITPHHPRFGAQKRRQLAHKSGDWVIQAKTRHWQIRSSGMTEASKDSHRSEERHANCQLRTHETEMILDLSDQYCQPRQQDE